MNTDTPTALERLLAAAKTSAHAKTIAAGMVALLSAGTFLLKTCSESKPATEGLADQAQKVIDRIQDTKVSITPPNENEIAKDVQDEVRSAQNNDSFFMDDTKGE